MNDPTYILGLISTHGIFILTLLAIVEGPIVTVIGAWLASMSVLSLPEVFVCVVLGDLVGDTALYLVGRHATHWVPVAWARRLGITRRNVTRCVRGFRNNGPRLLVLGKLTHGAGFALLIAAGVARMPFGQFILVNLAATLPKSLFFVALGYLAGSAFAAIGQWLFVFSFAVIGLVALILFQRWRQLKPKLS